MLQTMPQQIYIDVESHEMVDVQDVKGGTHYSSPSSFIPDSKAMSTISEGPKSHSDSRGGSELSV